MKFNTFKNKLKKELDILNNEEAEFSAEIDDCEDMNEVMGVLDDHGYSLQEAMDITFDILVDMPSED
jgi:predicted transcriptional regulator